MLNGKFYTGLPPKMMDRGGSGGRNRLESHLFWPDDTQVDTALESRIKRRNSVQLASTEKPLYKKQNSVAESNVDTKKRFTKEFSQSSIQFYDNLNDSRGYFRRNSVSNKKMEIAEKPTNTKLELPDNVDNEAYTAAKKKQAYTSKIEFYDYANDREESQNSRNNLRKPKMDMNDKREMELNSKNSPKLQAKRDVRSLSEEKDLLKINNSEVRAVEKPTRSNNNDIRNQRPNYFRSRRSMEPRINVSPKRGMAKSSSNLEHYYSETDFYREPEPVLSERRKPTAYYENFEERDVILSPRDYENLDDESFYSRQREERKRIIRNNTRKYYNAPDERDYSSQQYQYDEEVGNRMRDIRLKSPPPRKQYYQSEDYYDEEPQHYYGRNDQVKTPTNRGSSQQSFDYIEKEDNEADLPYKFSNNNPKMFNTKNQSANKLNNEIQQRPVVSPSPSDAESSISATRSQKHLRSSLCFNNGEIIGENDANKSPTSPKHSTQRRNARSSATQRVSVGLPD